jgi:hypothetical protein
MKTRSSPRLPKIETGALLSTILYNEKGEITYLRQGKVNYEALKGEIEKTLSEKMMRSENLL